MMSNVRLNRFRHVACAVAACLSLACGTVAPPRDGGSAPAAGVRVTPVVDYHTHLYTERVISRIFPPPLPAVDVPSDIADLLRERERRWNDAAGLAELYAENSTLLDVDRPVWLRGRKRVAESMAGLFARQYRVKPVAFGLDGSVGYLAGYYVRDTEAGLRHFGHVLLSLERSPDGVLRIAGETPSFPGPRTAEAMTAKQLVSSLDVAGIRRAVVLSAAYWYGTAGSPSTADEAANVRGENRWVAQQVAQFPDRLIAFCSVNPLKDYAVDELARCATEDGARGIKLHFGDSGVDLRNAEHRRRVIQVFRAANERRLAIVVHLMTPDPTYGREHSQLFLEHIAPAAPEIPIQIAHMAGSGPNYNSDEAFAVFAEAAAAGDPRVRNFYVDVATVVTLEQPAETLALIARRLREFGLHRVLYASDTPASLEFTPEAGWIIFRRLPLTDQELARIASNVAPYVREARR